MNEFEMERKPKLNISSVYGICAMKAFERRTDMDIANGTEIACVVAPMIKTLFDVMRKTTCPPDYLSPDDCTLKSEMLSELIDITVTPYEYATLWNEHVLAWEEDQMKGMCPIATVYHMGTDRRILICWDDFGDLMLHSARGVVAPGEIFGNASDDENLRRIRDVIKRIYTDVEFTLYAYGSIEKLAEALVLAGNTASRLDLEEIKKEYQFDDDAMAYLRRLMNIIISSSVG